MSGTSGTWVEQAPAENLRYFYNYAKRYGSTGNRCKRGGGERTPGTTCRYLPPRQDGKKDDREPLLIDANLAERL